MFGFQCGGFISGATTTSTPHHRLWEVHLHTFSVWGANCTTSDVLETFRLPSLSLSLSLETVNHRSMNSVQFSNMLHLYRSSAPSILLYLHTDFISLYPICSSSPALRKFGTRFMCFAQNSILGTSCTNCVVQRIIVLQKELSASHKDTLFFLVYASFPSL